MVNIGGPGYLGRLITRRGITVGTCFQVSPGVLVTAHRILDGDNFVSPFVGGPIRPVSLIRADPARDLAVLHVDEPFPVSARLADVAGTVPPATALTLSGARYDDRSPGLGRVDTPGKWQGTVVRDALVFGRTSCGEIVPEMSGAPVRRLSDEVVVGVVSARDNATDHWAPDAVWVIRAEDVRSLLAGLTAFPIAGRPVGPSTELVLEVTASTIRLTGAGIDISTGHRGSGPGLRRALGEYRRAGQLMAKSFLSEPLTGEFARVLRRAEAEGSVVRLAIDAEAPFADLPWEALPHPVDSRPLALCPFLVVYRKVTATELCRIPGPLRIVVAIAAPENNGIPVLDYERELRNILAAVRTARQGEAQVRIVPFATTSAIRAELATSPAHVLHLSGHGTPGRLLFEDEAGRTRPLTAEAFVDEAVPAGAMPPVFVLAACHTHESPSFSAGLLSRGASVVIGAESAVSDTYATRMFAQVYSELTASSPPDVVAAVAHARRAVHAELSAAGDEQANRDEWGVVTVHAATGTAVLFDAADSEPLAPSARPALRNLLGPDTGDFVGRRREQRELLAFLFGSEAGGVLLYGIGGVGKSALAAEIVRRIQESEPARLVVVLAGELETKNILAAVAAAAQNRGLPGLAELVTEPDQPWQDGMGVLRNRVFGKVPLLLVLDHFEDNLSDGKIRDSALAGLLEAWAGNAGSAHLLITSRHPVALPGIELYPIGPMSLSETRKLAWSLPALDALPTSDLETAWSLVDGHPRVLEYLNAALADGRADTVEAAAAVSGAAGADDIRLDALLAGMSADVQRQLVELSVHREPIETPEDLTALLATGLATVDHTGRFLVHRWLSDELIRRWKRQGRDAELRSAHRKAATYRGDTIAGMSKVGKARYNDAYAKRYHLLHAGEWEEASRLTEHICSAHYKMGQLKAATALIEETFEWLSPDSPWYAALLRTLGLIAVTRGDYAEAETHYGAALRTSRRLMDDREIAACLGELSQLAYVQDDYQSAQDLLSEAMTVSASAGDEFGVATAHLQLGKITFARGVATKEVLHHFRAALGLYVKLDEGSKAADCYFHFGMVALSRGRHDWAERRYLRALDIYESRSDQRGAISVANAIADLAVRSRDFTKAERYYQRLLRANERIGDRLGMVTVHRQLGMIAFELNDDDEADRCYRRSLEIGQEIGALADVARTVHQLGKLSMHRSRISEALGHYVRALEIRRGIPVEDYRQDARVLHTLREKLGREWFDHAALEQFDLQEIADLHEFLDSMHFDG
jgi:tetratricopeptide (TPR) repeat protein